MPRVSSRSNPARSRKRSKPATQLKDDSPQKRWLVERYPLFLDHQAKKATGKFFPRLYEDYFAEWPPTATEEEVASADGNADVAVARARKKNERKIYRWMHNRTRTKHGVRGQGGPSATLNLTAGPPKKKAALQAYVKYYWESKIKQEVINLWAPTRETDLFGEIETGEDHVAWEAMTPMEKNIPLWFRMKVGRKLYEAESEEVKEEVDRRREQEKLGAIADAESATVFTTDEERLQVMKRFNENFPRLNSSLTNLCANIHREFGLHTSIIVGGPIVRQDGRLSGFTFESPGTKHKELTFSEYLGKSYETDVSEKFIEYLKLCFPGESRQLYTLGPIPDTAAIPPDTTPVIADLQPAPPTVPVPQASSTPSSPLIGPIRTASMSRTKTIPSNVQVTTTSNEPNVAATTATIPGATPPLATDVPNGASDGGSYTSLPDIGMDDSAPAATGPSTIIDHLTPTVPTVAAGSPPAGVEVAITPYLNTPYLVETPATLLSEDEDVRPQWLMTAVKTFLRFVPGVGRVGKVIDLFLAQEARLGYPHLSTRLPLPSSNRPTEVADFMKWGRKYSRGSNVDAEKFGAAVLEWWLTIQPITRKNWPPVYDALPDDFSFDYFNHGGPNGTFLMILCLGWWAKALDLGMDFTEFDLVVNDVHWVLSQIADRA